MSEFSGYLEIEEIHKIISAVKLVSKHPERDQLLLETMWQTGSRVSEVIHLVPERVGTTSIVLNNLKQVKRVKVPGKEKPDRVHNPDALKEVEVSAELCQRIKDFCVEHSIHKGEWVFKSSRGSKSLNRWYVWDLVTRASEKAMIFKFGKKNPKTGGRFKGSFPHLFRHANAQFLLEKTSDIMLVKTQLGHANVSTTQMYAFTKKPKIRAEIKKIQW